MAVRTLPRLPLRQPASSATPIQRASGPCAVPCHSEIQARWASTKHASAWTDLQASGTSRRPLRGLSHGRPERQCIDGPTAATRGQELPVPGRTVRKLPRRRLDHAALAGPTTTRWPRSRPTPAARMGAVSATLARTTPSWTSGAVSGHAVTKKRRTKHRPVLPGLPHGAGRAARDGASRATTYKEKDASPDNDHVRGLPRPARLAERQATPHADQHDQRRDNLCMKCHQRRGTFQDEMTHAATACTRPKARRCSAKPAGIPRASRTIPSSAAR